MRERCPPLRDSPRRVSVAVLNWVEHVEASGVQAYVVGAMDNELLQELVGRGIHTFSMDSGLE